jgi:uncharacterized protein YybS (DUF2232 family)
MKESSSNTLSVMRFWLIGTFLIVFAAVIVYIGLFVGSDWARAMRAGFPIWGAVGLLCLVWYHVYKFIMGRRALSADEFPPEVDDG